MEINVRCAKREEAGLVSELATTAFLESDSWYKKPDCVMRTDATFERVLSFIDEPSQELGQERSGVFLVAEDVEGKLRGVIKLDWPVFVVGVSPAHFCLLSVPSAYGGCGIGRALVKAAEEYALQKGSKAIEMVVVTSRTTLVVWYEKQGFSRTGDDFPAFWTDVIADEHVGSVMACNMRKCL